MSAPERSLRSEALEAEMLRWLNRRVAPPGRIVDRGTPLFADGLVDSLRILEIIAWVEQATGRTIPDREIRMDNFHSVGRIWEVFFREVDGVDA